MQTRMDHLVIGANNLTQGVAYVKDLLGCDMPYGGAHVKMGTHNHLMQIGDAVFLEVIAINPDGESPEMPRWFGLDDPFIRRRIEDQPTLLTWVVRTPNIDGLLQQSRFSFGKATLIRRGNLSWRFGLSKDGRLFAGGMLPYVIEWQTDQHPANHMADLGCKFQGLEIYHPHPSWLKTVLASIGAARLVNIHALPKNRVPYLMAHFHTPKGTKTIRSDLDLVNKALQRTTS